ncbi:NYN domain-containing protein [Methylobacterium sp. 88A]|uniref:NYN domain-containing protein n=1 Tax=Methylobacterium sp. 88A TaxID=1131813 RepID=UPI0012F68AB6|nr:NYN domain-containing protein [Methylobacterium sp. 88A]
MQTNVYIDGFNFYYGRLKGTAYKWLDLERFCDQILPRNTVERIYYFTAKVDPRPHDLDQPARQLAYIRALATLPRVEVHFGNFLSSVTRQPLVESDPTDPRRWLRDPTGKPVPKLDETGKVVTDYILKTEEKGSDVNLAAYLLRDAYKGSCECAVIVSNDSDLLTPIQLAKTEGLTIGLIPPRKKGSVELKGLANFKADPRLHHLSTSQFPDTFADANGTIQKPSNW